MVLFWIAILLNCWCNMNNIVNQVSYLRTSREFPEDLHQLSVEVNKTYVDIANCVNSRTIGLFPMNRAAVTGESWYLSGNRRQQTLRQVYPFGIIAAGGILNIPYKLQGFSQFSRIYGTCITSTDFRPIPYASLVVNSNIDIRVTTTNIVIAVGAASPALVSGIIILEWLSDV